MLKSILILRDLKPICPKWTIAKLSPHHGLGYYVANRSVTRCGIRGFEEPSEPPRSQKHQSQLPKSESSPRWMSAQNVACTTHTIRPEKEGHSAPCATGTKPEDIMLSEIGSRRICGSVK